MTKIPTQAEYENREREIHAADLQRSERGSPAEIREATKSLTEAMATDPDLIAERIEWLLAGHYGKGAYDAAWAAVASPFIKPNTTLFRIIASLEWMVPVRGQRRAAHRITAHQHLALTKAIDAAVKNAKASREG